MEGFFSRKETQSVSRPDGKSRTCVSCGLYKECNSPRMKPEGNFKKKIINIFPYPEQFDDRKGKAFQSKEARTLEKAYDEIGIDLHEDCLNMYAVHCFSDEQKNSNVDYCRSSTLKIIKNIKPSIIVLFGNLPLDSIIGYRWQKGMDNIYKWRGWTIPDQDFQTWIIPTFEVSQINSNSNIDEILWKQDLKKVKECLNKPFPKFEEPEIITLNKRNLSILDTIENKTIAFDYETTGIKPQMKGHKIICASVAVDVDKVYVFEVPRNIIANKPFRDLLERNNVKKVAQNMKFEDTWSNVILNTKINGWTFDTMLGTHILDNRPGIVGLKFQTYVQFGVIDYDSEIAPYLKALDKKDANSLNRIEQLMESSEGKEKLLKYCALDSIFELKLYKNQMEEFKKRNSEESKISQAYALFHEGTLALAKAERQGLRIDVDYCEMYVKKLDRRIQAIEEKIYQTKFYKHWQHSINGKINLNSEPQLRHYLYDVKKLKPPKFTENGDGSTDEEALKMLKIPELDLIIQRSKYHNIKNTNLENILREQIDGYLHPFFNLQTARTYRSSSSNPNFQNQPKRDKKSMKIVRGAFYPRLGHQLLEMDFGSIEVAIAATYHFDPTMIKYIKDPTTDMHGDMAKQIFMLDDFDKNRPDHAFLRNCIKNSFVFPQFYGDYYVNCAHNICGVWTGLPVGYWKKGDGYELKDGTTIGDHLIKKGIKSYMAFESHLEKIEKHFWTKRFPIYARWKEKHWKNYQNTAVVKMHTGFECTAIMGRNNAINYPVQGAAFHCLLWLFFQLDEFLTKHRFDTKLIGQIHDSIVLDVNPNELEDVYKVIQNIGTKQILKAFPWINVPLKIEADLSPVDGSWAELEKFDPLKKEDDKLYYYYHPESESLYSSPIPPAIENKQGYLDVLSLNEAQIIAKQLDYIITSKGEIVGDDLPF